MHTENQTEKLLDSGEKLFSEFGFDGASTRDLAKVAGCNVALISYYFGGKKGLYEAVLKRHFERAALLVPEESKLESLWPELSGPSQRRLCSVLFAIASTVVSETKMRKILCREMSSGAKSAARVFVDSEKSSVKLLREEITGRVERREFRADLDWRTAFITLMGPIVYSVVASSLLGQVLGIKKIDQAYMRTLCVQLTQDVFKSWKA